MSDQASTRRPIRLSVEDVMTSDVVTVSLDTPFKQVGELMAEHRISAVPVVDADGAVVGVVSEADLMLKSEAPEGEPGGWGRESRERRAKTQAQTAERLMSAPAITVEPGSPLAAAARLMRKQGVKRLPVVDGGRLVGILSRADVLKSYLRSDDAIRTDVVEGVIRGSMWMDPATIEVTVEDGLVTMRGEVERRSEVDILGTLALGVEGVVAVEANLTYRFDDRHVIAPNEHRHSGV